ncbi:hypothetical protein GYMLUDRAFT_251101 [Collybiopsis luxurians FD-317 M1]|uniref:Unplaced genomic scaffold GYMLUscaffold_92, whole genome shotgun sequence n=1 Tax=Collybiopsis luxurians FD-317 M1 TaxID=944289 RepID=A0A0D0AQJ9_9AGAR|nr:hypothetical protein GYMLUDRAFT_251101 [Collybiopsis luxurians FD-317 M1]
MQQHWLITNGRASSYPSGPGGPRGSNPPSNRGGDRGPPYGGGPPGGGRGGGPPSNPSDWGTMDDTYYHGGRGYNDITFIAFLQKAVQASLDLTVLSQQDKPTTYLEQAACYQELDQSIRATADAQ